MDLWVWHGDHVLARVRCTSVPVYSFCGHDVRVGEIQIAHTLVGQVPDNVWFRLTNLMLCSGHLISTWSPHPTGFLTYTATRIRMGVRHIYKTWDIYAQHVCLACLDGACPPGNICNWQLPVPVATTYVTLVCKEIGRCWDIDCEHQTGNMVFCWLIRQSPAGGNSTMRFFCILSMKGSCRIYVGCILAHWVRVAAF